MQIANRLHRILFYIKRDVTKRHFLITFLHDRHPIANETFRGLNREMNL